MTQENKDQKKPLVLIIEDDPQLVTIFATAMEVAGYEAVTAEDGRVALDKLAVLTPDVILLDVHLPLVSGDDLLRHIRADDRLKDSRVILSTADSRIASQLREEASLVLLKPVSFKELIELASGFGQEPIKPDQTG